MKNKLQVNPGDKYNRLTILKEVKSNIGPNGIKTRKFKCRCECGNITLVVLNNLRNGHTKSCGCLQKEIMKNMKTIHGFTKRGSNNLFFFKYKNLKNRCNNKNNKSYKDYGGRGIKNKWDTFEEFRDDMYESYLEHKKIYGDKNTTIDRIDVNGNYCKENCRWSTMKEQCNNTRKNIIYEGKCISDISKELGGNSGLISKRLKSGWTLEKACTTLVKH